MILDSKDLVLSAVVRRLDSLAQSLPEAFRKVPVVSHVAQVQTVEGPSSMPGTFSELTRSTIAWRFVRERRETAERHRRTFTASVRHRGDVLRGVYLCLLKCLN